MKEGVKMHFSPRKDLLFRFIIWGLISFLIIIPFIGGESAGFQLVTYNSLLGRMMIVCIIFMLGWFWFGVSYKLEGDELIVRYGPFKKVIAITSIHSIRKTRNPFTAPALAMDRLELMYGKYNCIQIALKEEDVFIERLQKIHPKIKKDIKEGL